MALELPDRQPDETAVMASVVQPPCDSQVPPTLVSSATTVPGQPDVPVNTPPKAVVQTMPTPSPPADPVTPPAPPAAVLQPARERALTATVLEETEPGDSVSNAAATPYDPNYWRPPTGLEQHDSVIPQLDCCPNQLYQCPFKR